MRLCFLISVLSTREEQMILIIFGHFAERQSFIKIDDVARRTLLVNKHRQCSGEHSGIMCIISEMRQDVNCLHPRGSRQRYILIVRECGRPESFG